jgi:hypothetical protein
LGKCGVGKIVDMAAELLGVERVREGRIVPSVRSGNTFSTAPKIAAGSTVLNMRTIQYRN